MDAGLIPALIGMSTLVLCNIGAFLYSYGRLGGKVDGLNKRLDTLEQHFTNHLAAHGRGDV